MVVAIVSFAVTLFLCFAFIGIVVANLDMENPMYVGLPLAIVALVFSVFVGYAFSDMERTEDTNSGESYGYCNSQCKPELMTCTGIRPESQWSICEAQYQQCLKRCK